MKRTRREPSHFLNRSLYDDDEEEEEDDTSSWESGDQFMKIPEEESDEEDDYNESPPPPPPQPERKHFCVICNRQFSSGKAYGGHVRIHSKEDNKKGKMKMMKMKKMKKGKRKIGLVVKKKKKNKGKEKEIDLIRADVEGKIRCCLCGKEFQTMHSLFGHMSRHPDRSWKGIPPPSSPSPDKYNNNLSTLHDDSSDDDVMSRFIDVAEDVQEAACNLMMLSYASRNYSKDGSLPKKR